MQTNNDALSKMLYAACPSGYVDEDGNWTNGVEVGAGTNNDPVRTEYPNCWSVFVFDLHCASARIVARLTNNKLDAWPHKLIGDDPVYEIKSITIGPATE